MGILTAGTGGVKQGGTVDQQLWVGAGGSRELLAKNRHIPHSRFCSGIDHPIGGNSKSRRTVNVTPIGINQVQTRLGHRLR